MRPSPEEAGPPASSGPGRRVAGYRLVLAVFGVAGAVAGLIILLAVVVDTPTDPDVACQQTPLVCDTMRGYAAAWNDRDAGRMRPLLTDRGLRTVLEVASEEELVQNLDALPPGDIIEELRITYPAGTTKQQQVMAKYKVLGMPSTYFIKPDGSLLQKWTGALNESKLTELVEKLIA